MTAKFPTFPPLQRLRLVSEKVHCPGLRTLVFRADGEHTARLAPAKAGQYVALTCEVGGSRVTRAYTLASSPLETERDGIYVVTVKKAGILSGYLCDCLKVGDCVLSSVPYGDFVYDSDADCGHIVGVAGGAGITALLSLAKDACERGGYTMTLFYCVENSFEFLFDEELDSLPADKVKVVRVAADGKRKNAEKGFFTRELIDKHVILPFTLFMCGGDEFYRTVRGETEAHPLLRGVRTSPNGVTDRAPAPSAVYSLTVATGGETRVVPCRDNETLLVAMERAGLAVRSACHTGRCGFCRSTVEKGDFTVDDAHDTRSEADVAEGIICPCCTYPESDIILKAPRAHLSPRGI